MFGNNKDIFSDYRTQIFSSRNKKDMTVDDSSEAQSTISAYMNFIIDGSKVTQSYHFSIMKQAQSLIVLFSVIFFLVTIFICVMIGYIIISNTYQAATLIPLLSGLATDVFSGSLILVMKNLMKSRDEFFKENVKAEHFSKIIGLIHTLQEDKDKIPFIKTIINDYCDDNSTSHRIPHD